MKGFITVALIAAIGGCAPGAAQDPHDRIGGKADGIFDDGPLYLTGAFDGSKKFQMWVDTMEFARRIQHEFSKSVHFTYFINSCYFDMTVRGSAIGTAKNQLEISARWALVQQAVNEGHEIGNHTVRHKDGTEWSRPAWKTELTEFHDLVDGNLFKPVIGDDGEAVFPKWESMPGAAAGEVGTTCDHNADCNSGLCIPITATKNFCSDTCNKNRPCANGTACGAPDWHTSLDQCVPVPAFPVVHQGQELFDSSGAPNLAHPALETYPVVGFRAPQLGHNGAMFEELAELGYVYDTSKILRPGPPSRVVHKGQMFETLYEFPLMKNPGSRTVPMDYNYLANEVGGDRMLRDYQQSVIDAYQQRGREPWNVGHHFALWKGGAYWRAMQDTFTFAARGCPDAEGIQQCAEVEFPSFIELAEVLDSKSDGLEDVFADEHADDRDESENEEPHQHPDDAH